MDSRAPSFSESNWLRRALMISVWYNSGNTTVRDIAAKYDVSIGMVSESLKIAKYYELIKDCKTRKEALKILENHG